MSEPTENGNGHGTPEPVETMMAAVVAIPKPADNKLTYELRLNPNMSLTEQVDFCIMLANMAATSAARIRSQERNLPKIQAATLGDLPPDLKLPPMGRRGKGRG